MLSLTLASPYACSARLYRPSAYYVAKQLAVLPFAILNVLVFSYTLYGMAGLRLGAWPIIANGLSSILIYLIAQQVGASLACGACGGVGLVCVGGACGAGGARVWEIVLQIGCFASVPWGLQSVQFVCPKSLHMGGAAWLLGHVRHVLAGSLPLGAWGFQGLPLGGSSGGPHQVFCQQTLALLPLRKVP